MDKRITVLIADDHHMVRSSLALFLQMCPEFELVAQAQDGEEAVQMALQYQPRVILMDMMMPRLSGTEATRKILEHLPTTLILALSSFKEDSLVQEALRAGAISYLLKNASLEELQKAILDATNGITTIASEAMQALLHQVRFPAPVPQQFTPREREILRLMVQGQTNRQMSLNLSLSLSTIKFHVSSILAKLNAASRTEAVALALQHHLLED